MKADPNRTNGNERPLLFFWLMLPEDLQEEVNRWRSIYNPSLITRYDPHITVGKFRTGTPEAFYGELSQLAADNSPLRVHLHGHMIGGPSKEGCCTILIKVARTPMLTDLQDQVQQIGGRDVRTPRILHITLGHVHQSRTLQVDDFFDRIGGGLFRHADVVPQLHIQCNGKAVPVENQFQSA